MRSIKVLTILITSLLLPVKIFAANDFYDQRYRGWIWFEEEERTQKQQKIQESETRQQQQQQKVLKARIEVKRFAKELEDLKYLMIDDPTNIAKVTAYKKKEAEMLAKAITLDHSHRLALLRSPDLVDHLKNPINLYGKKIKEKVDEENNTKKIKQLSTMVELFLFFSSSCPYSLHLEPVLHKFADKYGFKVEAVSLDGDGSQSRYFTTHHNKDLIASLELQFTPTIILVTNDSSIRFELIRGAASLNEIEEQSLLALEHLKSLQNSANNGSSRKVTR